MNKKPKKIVAKIEATHSGIVNGNHFMYIPDGMKNGEVSFVKPYKKPVTDGHPSFWGNEKDSPVIGRVIDAQYESYNIDQEFDSLKSRDENMPDLVQRIYKIQCEDKDFKGTGHMTVTAEISDPEAIQQVIDGRKLTVSIGAYMDNARCSICGSRYGDCEHQIGNAYDGLTAFRVGGNMKFDHVAFVKNPADENAMVQSLVVSDNTGDEFGFFITDEVKIIEYKEEKMLKDKIVDKFNSEFKKSIETDSGIKVFKKSIVDGYETMANKGRQHSFLFTDTRDVYLKDPLSLAIAYKVMTDISDEIDESEKEDFEALMLVIDSLIESKKYFTKDSVSEVIDSAMEVLPVEKGESETEKPEIQYTQEVVDMIADAVYKKLKVNDDNVNKYTKERVKVLESAIVELEDCLSESNSIIDKLVSLVGNDVTKDSLVEYIDKILKVEDSTDIELEKIPQQKLVMDEDVVPPVEDTNTVDDVDYDVVRATYRQKLTDSGFPEAKKYLKTLRDNNKIPDNFIL